MNLPLLYVEVIGLVDLYCTMYWSRAITNYIENSSKMLLSLRKLNIIGYAIAWLGIELEGTVLVIPERANTVITSPFTHFIKFINPKTHSK